MRLIDADILKERVGEMIVPEWVHTLVRTLIDDNATIDAVPVVHGEWIRHGCDEEEFEYYECPLCGFIGLKYNYCPNCGARMRGEHDGSH